MVVELCSGNQNEVKIWIRGHNQTKAVIRQPSSPGKVSVQKLKSKGDAMQSQ